MYKYINEPSAPQRLLLQASLLGKEASLHAWKKWQETTDVDSVDVGSFRLLPLLYHNLTLHGIDEPSMQKYKGVYRYTWSKNQRLLFHIRELLRVFKEEKIPSTLLKGGALIPLYYRNLALRPMQDFDLLVPRELALKAIGVLQKKGWAPMDWQKGFAAELPKIQELFLSIKHAHGFVHPGQVELDLHWHLFHGHCKEGIDREIFDACLPLDFHGIQVGVLNPTDQLFHVCVHGASHNLVPPLRWVADAIMILRGAKEQIDPERLASQAKKYGCLSPLKDALHYLQQYFEAPVPLSLLQRVDEEEKLSKVHAAPAFRMPTFPERIAAHWRGHAQSLDGANLLRRLLTFPRFLRILWGLHSVFQIPARAGEKTVEWFEKRGRTPPRFLLRLLGK